MRYFRKDGVTGGDTYEIACAHLYPEVHWSEAYLYFPDEEDGIGVLAPYLDQVFAEFAYYGPQKVTLEEWGRVRELCLADHPDAADFFDAVDAWQQKENRNAPHFWILGI